MVLYYSSLLSSPCLLSQLFGVCQLKPQIFLKLFYDTRYHMIFKNPTFWIMCRTIGKINIQFLFMYLHIVRYKNFNTFMYLNITQYSTKCVKSLKKDYYFIFIIFQYKRDRITTHFISYATVLIRIRISYKLVLHQI